MSQWIKEPARRLPVTASYDVVVVGGGIAGVAAAVSAARLGVKVALLEKEYSLGGLATLGNVIVYLPLCDGKGHQVIGGLGEELLKLSVKDGYHQIPACWRGRGSIAERTRERYLVRFNPAFYLLALEELLVRENVELYYDTRFCEVTKKGSRIDTLIIENKDGRTALKAGAVVDASGDADVCARAGEETVSLATNTLSGWYFYQTKNTVQLSCLSKAVDFSGDTTPEGLRGYAGDVARDVTDHVVDTRAFLRSDLLRLKKSLATPVMPLLLSTIPGLRMTRRLKGKFELATTDERRLFPDTIGMTGDWRHAGPVYSIPLRAIAGLKTPNLITAGRCISAGSAWDVTRVIPTCAVTGEAAGTASALLSRSSSKSFLKMDLARLQKQLKMQRVILEKKLPALPET